MTLRLLFSLSATTLLLACGSKPGSDDTGDLTLDRDADGFTAASDCDDTNPSVYPGAEEICDQLDNDCDSEVDEDGILTYADLDGDGYGDPDSEQMDCEETSGRVLVAEDCDDTNPEIRPGAEEVCDGFDNDCDSSVDAPGLVSFVGENGIVTDYSNLMQGTAGVPAQLTLGEGTLSVCEGTYYVNVSITDAASIVGFPEDGGSVVLDGAGSSAVVRSFLPSIDFSLANLTLTGGTGIVDEWGGTMGGGIAVDGRQNGVPGGGTVTLTDVVVSGNTAESGGGLYLWGVDANLYDVQIIGNTAENDGWAGGALFSDSTVVMERVLIEQNDAGYTGGVGIHSNTVSSVSRFEDVIVRDNTSRYGAAALYVSGNILEWSATSDGASAMIRNVDSAPDSYWYGVFELQYGELYLENVDLGEEGSTDDNSISDLSIPTAGTFNAGNQASLICTDSGCGAITTLSLGDTDSYFGLSPDTVVGQVFQVDSGSAATLDSYSFDYVSGKNCASGVVSLLHGGSPTHNTSSSWTVLASRYATVVEGSASGEYFGYPMRENQVYAIVYSPQCSVTTSTASLGYHEPGLPQDLGFGETLGYVTGAEGSSTMNLTFYDSEIAFDATMKAFNLD